MAQPWSVACLLSWLGVTPHDTDLFMSLKSPALKSPHNQHNPQPSTATEGSILIIRMSPPPFRSYSPHSLERRGMNTEHVWPGLACVCYVITHCAQSRGEGHGKGSEYPMSSLLYQCCLPAPLMMTPLTPVSSLTKQIIVPRLASHGH